jgi:multisubunit Na+/H+ antiporter MnhE subunit
MSAVLLWIVLSVFEIALIGRLDAEETPVGVAIALLATLVAVGALAVGNVTYAFRIAWLWLPLLVVRNVVRDTFVVYGALLRRLTGGRIEDAFLEIPFEPGGDDPASAARRALATAGVSTSPNEIVLEIDAEKRTMLVHALVVTNARRRSAEWPL